MTRKIYSISGVALYLVKAAPSLKLQHICAFQQNMSRPGVQHCDTLYPPRLVKRLLNLSFQPIKQLLHLLVSNTLGFYFVLLTGLDDLMQLQWTHKEIINGGICHSARYAFTSA